MIWVLLEITLPLCLAFLFGLGAGWLFWRWRRRSISQAEWNKHGETNTAEPQEDTGKLLQQTEQLKGRATQLEGTIESQVGELKQFEQRNHELSVELKSAKEALAQKPAISSLMSQDTSANDKQLQSKVEELQFKSDNLESTVENKTAELAKAEIRIASLTTELTTTKDQLEIQAADTSAEDLAALQTKLNLASAEKAQIRQSLQDTSVSAEESSKKANELQIKTEILESTIEKQTGELMEAEKHAQQLSDELEAARKEKTTQTADINEKVTALEASLAQAANDKSRIQQEKEQAEQKQKDTAARAETSDKLVAEIQAKLANRDTALKNQNAELQAIDKNAAQLASDLAAANDELARQKSSSSKNIEALQSNVDVANTAKTQLEEKLRNLSARAEQQSTITSELQQKLKQAETVATERDSAIAKIKQLEDQLAAANLKATELDRTKSQLDTIDQKFKNFQASVVANRQTVEEDKAKQNARIDELKSALNAQRGLSADNAATKQRMQQLEAQLAQSSNATSDLNQAKAEIASLNKQLTQSRIELANKTSSADRDNQLSRENPELRDAQAKLAEVTTQLNNARARNNQLAASIGNTEPKSAVTPISVGQIKKLTAQIKEKEKHIAELEAKLKRKRKPVKSKAPAKKGKLAWQQGETKIGTPGCDHKDDLTAISGIGPKIQKVLNKLGIKSWEQLATLKVADVKRVDEALVDFSGRIQRDEWVAQAKAIMRNGHQPMDAKPKKAAKKPARAKKNKSSKNSWQSGQTRLGTPGSAHRDDLKVINGIGPVIEKSLNWYGIKSWEQLACLKVKEVKAIDEALDFPGRIDREQWVAQAKDLVKQFPNQKDRPTRRTFLNQAAAG